MSILFNRLINSKQIKLIEEILLLTGKIGELKLTCYIKFRYKIFLLLQQYKTGYEREKVIEFYRRNC